MYYSPPPHGALNQNQPINHRKMTCQLENTNVVFNEQLCCGDKTTLFCLFFRDNAQTIGLWTQITD